MSLRNETFDIPVAKEASPQLTNVYGFAWNPGGPGNTVSSLAVVTVEMELEDWTRRLLVVRPGVWYGTGERINRAWFTCPTPGAMSVETALSAGDFVIAAQVPVEDPSQDAFRSVFYQTGIVPAGGNAVQWLATLALPSRCVGLWTFAKATVVNATGGLDGFLELPGNIKPVVAARLTAIPPAVNVPYWNIIGSAGAAEGTSGIRPSAIPNTGVLVDTAEVNPATTNRPLQFGGGYLPRSMRFGIFDPSSPQKNTYTVELLAIVGP